MKLAVEREQGNAIITDGAPGLSTSQGKRYTCRAADLLQRFQVTSPVQPPEPLSLFLNEHWKIIRPVAWRAALRESGFTAWVDPSLCGPGLNKGAKG